MRAKLEPSSSFGHTQQRSIRSHEEEEVEEVGHLIDLGMYEVVASVKASSSTMMDSEEDHRAVAKVF
jgi:hypothetical protein